MRTAAILLIIFLSGCASHNAASQYARAVLEQADVAAADALLESPGSLATRSQAAFLQGHSQVRYAPMESRTAQVRSFSISRAVVGGQEYSGQLDVELSADGSRVRASTLHLKRSDGTEVSL